MGYNNRSKSNEKVEKFLEITEDIFETGPIPLIVGSMVCILFNLVAMPCPIVLKVSFMVCGYVFLVFGIIKTFGNYD